MFFKCKIKAVKNQASYHPQYVHRIAGNHQREKIE